MKKLPTSKSNDVGDWTIHLIVNWNKPKFEFFQMVSDFWGKTGYVVWYLIKKTTFLYEVKFQDWELYFREEELKLFEWNKIWFDTNINKENDKWK